VGVVAVAALDQALAFRSSTAVWVPQQATGLTNLDKVVA